MYGDLADNSAFAAAFETWLGRLWAKGVTETVRAFVEL